MATDPKRLTREERDGGDAQRRQELADLGRATNAEADRVAREHDRKVAERYEREGRHLETLNEQLDRVAPIAPQRGRR